MSELKDKIDSLFHVLKNTAGIQSAFVLTSDSNIFFSDEKNTRNDSPELKVFMESSRFLDDINQKTNLHFKIGHWQFEKTAFSLYSVTNNKLLIVHTNELFSDKFDDMILDIMLDL